MIFFSFFLFLLTSNCAVFLSHEHFQKSEVCSLQKWIYFKSTKTEEQQPCRESRAIIELVPLNIFYTSTITMNITILKKCT